MFACVCISLVVLWFYLVCELLLLCLCVCFTMCSLHGFYEQKLLCPPNTFLLPFWVGHQGRVKWLFREIFHICEIFHFATREWKVPFFASLPHNIVGDPVFTHFFRFFISKKFQWNNRDRTQERALQGKECYKRKRFSIVDHRLWGT